MAKGPAKRPRADLDGRLLKLRATMEENLEAGLAAQLLLEGLLAETEPDPPDQDTAQHR